MPSAPNFPATPANETFPESNSRGIYTGESRQPFRERIQRMRDQKGTPKIKRRDTPIPSKCTSSSSLSNPLRTPRPPMPVLICPGAPRKGKVGELHRTSPFSADFDEDVLLDREAIKRTRKDMSPSLDVGGRRSPPRNSWSADLPVGNMAQPIFDRFALGYGGKGAGSKKTNNWTPRLGAIGPGGYSFEHRENYK
ncbi:hypothetical protein RRF57_012324 [Xylaria bambusicola]|uniref:Uncharacterized protein n=1 Tax=Xylaria bambusicola TaxID=326684 RepID=A0AAN7UV04_9PEZI